MSEVAAGPRGRDRAARRLNDLAGPRGWPIVGNLAQIELPHMHEQLEGWAVQYGPAYRIRLAQRNVLVVSNAETVLGVLRDRPNAWRRMRAMQEAIAETGAHGLFSAEGDDWRRQRRLVMSAFDPAHLKRYFPTMVRATERLKERLSRAARIGEAIDLQSVLMRYTVDVTAGLAFGIDINTQEHPDNPLQGHLDQMFPMLMRRINAPFPWWRYFKLPSDRAFDVHLSKVHVAIREFVAEARKRVAAEPDLREHPSNLLEAMLAAGDRASGGLSEEELQGNVLTILLAGEDTTANTLAWTLYLLHANRPALRELVEQVDAILGSSAMPATFDEARGLEFIERCTNESMRLRPVAPVLFLENNQDTVLEGVALPEGTLVICLMRRFHVEDGQEQDPREFRPGRWVQVSAANDLAQSHSSDRDQTKASMPFGAGPRMCPGRYLAMLEMKMVVAMLVKNFELIEVGNDEGTAPQERLAFTMFPVGLRMKLRERRG